jgi:hypothetical protein
MVDEFLDLCGICVSGPGCMNRGTRIKPKLFCEQFEVELAPEPAWEDADPPARPENTIADGPLRGLCCNCDNRSHCTITKPEGDIWHCEEYC